MRFRTFLPLLALAVGLGESACNRTDPRFVPISSSSSGAYARWRMSVSDSIRVEEWREFDAMLQELRVRIMANREATGHDAIESALRSKIHGATFREVLIIGLQAKLNRLGPEREAVRRVMNANARSAGILGKFESTAEFEDARTQQEKRMLAIDEEIRLTKRRLADFGRY